MAIIKQGILGGFKKKIGSVVGSSWKGVATMRSLPLSVANPRTAAQVENRNRFKACAEFASLILASIIKPLMDRFAGQMSGYNYFTKLNKEVFADPENVSWTDLVIAKGKMVQPGLTIQSAGSGPGFRGAITVPTDRYGLPTDQLYMLAVIEETGEVVYQGNTGLTRTATTWSLSLSKYPTSSQTLVAYGAYLRADGSEVSNTGVNEYSPT